MSLLHGCVVNSKMKEFNLISMPFYQWDLPHELTLDLLDLTKNVEYREKYVSSGAMSNKISKNDFEYQPLKNFIQNALTELKEKLYPGVDHLNLIPTQIWSNKTTFDEKHHKHNHINSIYTGIIYLTSHKDNAATRFYIENFFYYFEKSFLFPANGYDKGVNKEYFFDVFPEQGKMIIFPSFIKHETNCNIDTYDRYSISFNSFFSGKLGCEEYRTKLEFLPR